MTNTEKALALIGTFESGDLEKAKELLESTQMNIAEVSRKTGYESQSRFTSIFRTEYGVTPLEFRKKISILS